MLLEKLILTKDGAEILRRRLVKLQREFAEISRIKTGTAENAGNLWHDNPAFDEISAKQRMLIYAMDKIKRQLEAAQIIDPSIVSERSKVAIGSTVDVSINKSKTKKIVISDPIVANPHKGLISYQSPLGAAVLGAKANEVRSYQADGKKFEVEIIAIR